MRKITMQNFANIFNVFVCKDETGTIYYRENKPSGLKNDFYDDYINIINIFIKDEEECRNEFIIISPNKKY